MEVNQVPVEYGAALPLTVERQILRTGDVWLDGTPGAPATLDALLPLREHVRDLHVGLGSADLAALPELTSLERLTVQVRPRRLSLVLPRLRVLSVHPTPAVRKALAAAELPMLEELHLSGAIKGLLSEELPVRPRLLALRYTGDLREINPRMSWLARVSDVMMYRAGPLDLTELAALPSLRRLELHSVKGLEGLRGVGTRLADIDVRFENCHRVADPDAFLALRARSIHLVGDKYPISRTDADRLGAEDRIPHGPWALPMDLGGPDPFTPEMYEEHGELGIPVVVSHTPEFLLAEDYVPDTCDRLRPILRARIAPRVSTTVVDAEYHQLALGIATGYLLSGGDQQWVRETLADNLAEDWGVTPGAEAFEEFWGAVLSALDAPVNDR